MIKCIIIEDELPATEILKSYLAEIPDWTVAAEFTNAVDALSYLSRNAVDVIFLDIQLPKLSGISFIRSLKNPPLIVITTAYSEHAVEAFELTVFDYLLKPFPFERFLKAIHRINGHLQSQEVEGASKESYILVRENRENIKLAISDILFVESQKEYVQFQCEHRAIKTRMSMSKVQEILEGHDFLRVHRSFLIAMDKVDAFSRKQVTISGQSIPIGRYYQQEVRKRFE